MLKSKYILFVVFLLSAAAVSAQKAERDYIRKGNRLFNDSIFVDAEVNYRKALEVNPKSSVSMYNLGNTLSQQQKFQDAMEQYVAAGNIEKDKMKLAHIYHNMGVLFQAGKDYAKAVDAYKMSLRNNPTDDETRYNLALAQKMLKDQQQNQQNQDQNQDQKQDQNKDKQNDQKQDEKKDQQQPPKSEKQNNQMSKENAEQLLNSVMQDEKDVQDKVKKQQKVLQGGRLEKDW
ncbi:tetratricopeptide repeat protein [Bacteroides sp.]|uniref:tetratricopeptide repeat protein n=1 Tax=Bacteroides sp. TaxID=29523 RepID=UPI0025B91A32|nr:tetratricopeptide repeat protein [Bacteroides sp.]